MGSTFEVWKARLLRERAFQAYRNTVGMKSMKDWPEWEKFCDLDDRYRYLSETHCILRR